MLDQDSGDDDDNNTIRLRYLYRGEHKRDGRVATIACENGTIKTKAVLAALRRDRSVDLDRFGVALYDVKEEAWRTLTDLDDEVAVEGEARAELYDTLEQETDDAAEEAGYFGIGIVRGKTAGNAGVLWRSAAQLGAAFTFTVGARFEKEDDKTDAIAAWRRVPQFAYDDVAQLVTATPRGAALVGIEMGGQALETFAHPERCVYVLGAEDEGLPKSVRRACRHVVALPSIRSASYNVAVAGALVLYDRFMKRSRPVPPPPPLPTTVDVGDEAAEPVYLPIILVQRDAATASRVDALLEQRHGAAVVRKATDGDLSTEEFARARARFSVARAHDAGAVACSIAADPLLRGHVQRCLVLDRRVADVRKIALGAETYRVVAHPAGLATRVVDELPESVALGTAGATHLLCVCDSGEGPPGRRRAGRRAAAAPPPGSRAARPSCGSWRAGASSRRRSGASRSSGMYPAPRTTSRPAAARTNIRTRSRCWSRTVGARCPVFNATTLLARPRLAPLALTKQPRTQATGRPAPSRWRRSCSPSSTACSSASSRRPARNPNFHSPRVT